MSRQKKVKLDTSRLYGFRILGEQSGNALAAKIGGGKGKPVELVLGSKIGGGKVGVKGKPTLSR